MTVVRSQVTCTVGDGRMTDRELPIRIVPSLPQHHGQLRFAWNVKVGTLGCTATTTCEGPVDQSLEGALKRMIDLCITTLAENRALKACVEQLNQRPAEPLKNNPAPTPHQQSQKKARSN